MTISDVAAWAWAQAAVASNLASLGVPEAYLAGRFWAAVATKTPEDLVTGADEIRTIMAQVALSSAEPANFDDLDHFAVPVEHRDALATLLEPLPAASPEA